MSDWYSFLSSLTNLISTPLDDLQSAVGVPLLSALILGLIGSTSPCQLSTNVAALAFLAKRLDRPRSILPATGAYLLGKIAVYTILGLLVVLLGLQASTLSEGFLPAVRKITGPFLVLYGLVSLRLIRSPFSFGEKLGWQVQERVGSQKYVGAFLMGTAFALAFCPTLFLLFFGLLIPLSIANTGGVVFPAVFALGTTVPLLFFAGLLVRGSQGVQRYLSSAKNIDRVLRRIVAIILILVGLNEIIIYWFT